MANSFVRYTGNGSTSSYAVPFSYRAQADVTITIDGVATTAFTWDGAGTNITFTSPPANLSSIEIRRTTSQSARLVDYADGSVLKENDLDTDSEQGFFMSQEAIDDANDRIKLDNADFQWDAQSKRIKNVADPTANTDAVNKQYISTNIPNITTVAGIASDVTTVAGIASDVTAVAGDATDIGAVAAKATEIGLLGTSDAVADMNILATSDNVTRMATLGTSANVTAMGLLGTSANVTAMGLLGTADVVADMGNEGLSTEKHFKEWFSVHNCKLRIFDRDQIANHAEEVITQVYELRHPNPVNGVDLSINKGFLAHRGSDNHSWTRYDSAFAMTDLGLTSSPGTSGLNTTSIDPIAATDGTYVNHTHKEGTAHQATRHDWYVGLSASPTTIGSKTKYGLYFTLEYI